MPMDKDEYNRKRREKYAAKRAAGLSRNETRSTGKAIQKNPDLIQGLVGLFRGIVQGVDGAAQQVADVLTGGAKQLTKETTKNVSRGTKKKSNYVRKTTTSKKTGKRIPLFENFVKEQKTKNPKISDSELKKKYRNELGGTIADKKARETITEANKEGFALTRYYGRSKNPLKKKFLRGGKGKRYHYIVRYGFKVEGSTELEIHYITISHDEKLEEDEIINAVINENSDREGQRRNTRKKEYYTAKELVESSIHIEYAIDMEKP